MSRLAPALRAISSRAARRPPRTRGQALVEFAIILPVFVLLLVIAIDFGRMFFTYIEVTNAAREGAAFGAGSPTDLVGIQARTGQETNVQSQGGESALTVTATCADSLGTSIDCVDSTGASGPGSTITVRVVEPFTFLTPLVNSFFTNSFHMGVSATATVLGYAAGGGGSNPGSCSLPVPAISVITDNTLSVFADPTGSSPNSGVCSISGFTWTWGDGNDEPGSATGNGHTYLNAGTYTITLEVTNQAGVATTTETVTVPAGPPPTTCAPPTADFSWTNNKKVYTYLDRSTVADPTNCPISDWLWTFSDAPAGQQQSNAQNPAPVTYQTGSSHSVTLQVTNAGGTTSVTRSG